MIWSVGLKQVLVASVGAVAAEAADVSFGKTYVDLNHGVKIDRSLR